VDAKSGEASMNNLRQWTTDLIQDLDYRAVLIGIVMGCIVAVVTLMLHQSVLWIVIGAVLGSSLASSLAVRARDRQRLEMASH
jgi:hypothetical protein